jgi:hypothetical protein
VARRKARTPAAAEPSPGGRAATDDDAVSPGDVVINPSGPEVPAAAFAVPLSRASLRAPQPGTPPYLDVFRRQNTALRGHRIPLRENQRSSTGRSRIRDGRSVTRGQSPVDRCRMLHEASANSCPGPSDFRSRVIARPRSRDCAARKAGRCAIQRKVKIAYR